MKKYSCKEYSQNHRMFEMGREVIWFNTLHQTGHLEPVAQDHVQMAFKYLQGWTLHLSGQLVPVSDHPHSKKSVSWSSEGISCVSFVPITSSSITMLYLQSLTLFLALSLQVFITFSLRLFWKIPALSLFYIRDALGPFIITLALHWTCSSRSIALKYLCIFIYLCINFCKFF